jgi:hypothetical protein
VDKVLRLYARTEDRASTARQLAPQAAPPQAVGVALADGLVLAGYGQPVREFRAGDTIHLALYWDRSGAAAGVEASLVARSKSLTSDGQTCVVSAPWNSTRARLPDGNEPLARQQVDLLVPPDASPGRYAVALQALPGETALCLGDVVIRPWTAATSASADAAAEAAISLNLDFQDGVHLIGYELSAEQLVPGETLYLTLYWRAREPVAQRYKVFTHLLGEVYHAESDSFVWAQQDNEPVHGARPTSTWRSGEVIQDVYALPIETQAPAGPYRLEIGMYDPATGTRLAVLDTARQVTADHVVLATVQIKGP